VIGPLVDAAGSSDMPTAASTLPGSMRMPAQSRAIAARMEGWSDGEAALGFGQSAGGVVVGSDLFHGVWAEFLAAEK